MRLLQVGVPWSTPTSLPAVPEYCMSGWPVQCCISIGCAGTQLRHLSPRTVPPRGQGASGIGCSHETRGHGETHLGFAASHIDWARVARARNGLCWAGAHFSLPFLLVQSFSAPRRRKRRTFTPSPAPSTRRTPTKSLLTAMAASPPSALTTPISACPQAEIRFYPLPNHPPDFGHTPLPIAPLDPGFDPICSLFLRENGPGPFFPPTPQMCLSTSPHAGESHFRGCVENFPCFDSRSLGRVRLRRWVRNRVMSQEGRQRRGEAAPPEAVLSSSSAGSRSRSPSRPVCRSQALFPCTRPPFVPGLRPAAPS